MCPYPQSEPLYNNGNSKSFDCVLGALTLSEPLYNNANSKSLDCVPGALTLSEPGGADSDSH